MINCVDQLLINKPATMFTNNQKFIIHGINDICGTKLSVSTDNTQHIETDLNSFIESTYAKHKYLKLIGKNLVKNNILNKELCFDKFPNAHVADFFSFVINPFGTLEKTKSIMKQICKYLKQNKISFPEVAIRNPAAIKLLL